MGGQIQSASGMVYRGTAWLEALAADFKFREQECNGRGDLWEQLGCDVDGIE